MKWIIIVILSIFTACKNTKKDDNLKENNGPLSNELRSIIIDYQKKYPIPLIKKRDELYIYLVSFYKIKSDTIVTLKRPADGISSLGWDIIFGVYQDSLMLPTFIRDDSALYSNGLVNNPRMDSTSREVFSSQKNKDYSETFPPVYQYRKKNGKLMLEKIDTVWNKW